MKPAYSIQAFGGNIRGRVTRLEVTDGDGKESDNATIEVDDRNASVALPAKGTPLSISMGYEGNLAHMGLFVVDDVETNGYPQKATITATAADMTKEGKQPRNKGYEKKTIQDIAGEAAGRMGLAAEVSPSLASFLYEYRAQTAQSDMAFLSRIARDHGAVFKVADGKAILTRWGEIWGGIVMVRGMLANGGDCIDYSGKAMARPGFSKFAASWWDRDKVEEVKQEASGGGQSAEHLSTHHYPNEDEAQAAADGKSDEKGSEEGGVHLTIVGRPGVRALMGLTVVGVRPGSVDGFWQIKTATHTIDDSGYVTSIDAGLPGKGGGGQGGTS